MWENGKGFGLSMPSVLLVGNFLSGAGMSRGVCEDLAERLAGVGWRVLTASSKVDRIARLLDMVKTVWQCRSHYAVAQVDVFSGHAFLWAEIVSWVLHRIDKPFVLTLHGGNLPSFAQHRPRRTRRLLESATIVTTPSRYLWEQMIIYRPDLRVVPNPLDLSLYPFRVRSRPRTKLIWLRAFHSIYNPSLAIKVLANLLPDFPDIQLTMVGPDKHDGSMKQVQQLADDLGVSNYLRIVGPVPKLDVPLWLDKGDIFLNTTNIDNTPISVMEAMACGLCVVSTNVGGIPYLLTHEQDALLVPPADALAMSEAIKRLLNDSNLSERLSWAGHQTVSQMDWAIILPQWESLLEEAINKQQGKTVDA